MSNTPQAIAWALVTIVILAILTWTLSFAREHLQNRARKLQDESFEDAVQARRNDNIIFRTVEEAQRDFN